MKSSLFVLAALFLAVALAAPAPEAEAEPQDYLSDEFEDAYDYDAADVDEDVQFKFLGGFRRPIVFRRPIIARRPIVARRRFFG